MLMSNVGMTYLSETKSSCKISAISIINRGDASHPLNFFYGRPLRRNYCLQQRTITNVASATEKDQQATTSRRHRLSCGQQIEVISFLAEGGGQDKPPLLFVHGALHGAWCFKEHFLHYYSSRGYDAHALSLRGHGNSDYVLGQTGGLAEHTNDVASVVASLPRAPVLIAHSLGGIVAQRYLYALINGEGIPQLAGIGFIASPAVSAALGVSTEWFKQVKSFLHGLKIIWWMTAMPKKSSSLVQDLFFSRDIPRQLFERYHRKLVEQRSILPISGTDLIAFSKMLRNCAEEMKCTGVPLVVMSAGEDKLMMPCQVKELAEMVGTEVVAIPKVAHDLMLDTRWLAAAEALESWISGVS